MSPQGRLRALDGSGRALAAIALTVVVVGCLLSKGWSHCADAPLGFGVGLLAGAGLAAGTLVLKRHPVPVPSAVLTAWQLQFISVPLMLLALAFGSREWFVPSWQTVTVIG